VGSCKPSYRYPQACRVIPLSDPAVPCSNEYSSISEVVDIDTERLTPLAKELGLSVVSFGKHTTDLSALSRGTLNISNPLGGEFEPAPVSPYKDSVAFSILSGTIKAVYNAHRGLSDPSEGAIKVYPKYSTGNTGKRYPLASRGLRGFHRDLPTGQTPQVTGNFPKTFTDTIIKTSTHLYREVFIRSTKVSAQRLNFWRFGAEIYPRYLG